jgi:hypothetical protein
VLVWDEQQPAQKEAYDNFLGNAIAAHLEKQPGLAVRSVKLDDAEQGIGAPLLDNADVLVWWGHVRQAEVKPEAGRKIVERIRDRGLVLVALHSAHWATPFIEAMNERARADVHRTGHRIQFDSVSGTATDVERASSRGNFLLLQEALKLATEPFCCWTIFWRARELRMIRLGVGCHGQCCLLH